MNTIELNGKTYATLDNLNKATLDLDAKLDAITKGTTGTIRKMVLQLPETGRFTAVYFVSGGMTSWAMAIAHAGFKVIG